MDSSNYQSSLKRSGNRAWNFVDEEDEIHDKLDFPIIGGKSDLSRDPQKREEWKMKMMQRKQKGEEWEASAGFRPLGSGIKTKVEFDHEESMDEWFDDRRKL